jgi:hypothetical protein
MARSQRWATWLSSRRCQIIDSTMRGEGNGSSLTMSGHMRTRSSATRRCTTARWSESTSISGIERNGTRVAIVRASPRSSSASSMKFVSSPLAGRMHGSDFATLPGTYACMESGNDGRSDRSARRNRRLHQPHRAISPRLCQPPGGFAAPDNPASVPHRFSERTPALCVTVLRTIARRSRAYSGRSRWRPSVRRPVDRPPDCYAEP